MTVMYTRSKRSEVLITIIIITYKYSFSTTFTELLPCSWVRFRLSVDPRQSQSLHGGALIFILPLFSFVFFFLGGGGGAGCLTRFFLGFVVDFVETSYGN